MAGLGGMNSISQIMAAKYTRQTPVPAVLKVVMELVPKEAQARTMERVRRLLGEALFSFPS